MRQLNTKLGFTGGAIAIVTLMILFSCNSKEEFMGANKAKVITTSTATDLSTTSPTTPDSSTTLPTTTTANPSNTVTDPAADPILKSIAITPATPAVTVGTTQQLTAIGTYSDGSTKDITPSVTWTSTATPIGDFTTVGTPGLFTATTTGTVAVTATLGTVSGSSQVTVTGPIKVACTESLQYDPSQILCALDEVNHKTIWDTSGGWSAAVTALKNPAASWISPLTPTTVGSGTSAIQYCPYVPQSDKLIFVSHFVLSADETVTLEAVIDDVGQVRLWQDADPSKQVYISDKSAKVNGSVALTKGFYSVVIDGIDVGLVATGAIATIFHADGSVLKQTQNDKEWCIFKVVASTDVATFVKSASSCRYCLIGDAANK